MRKQSQPLTKRRMKSWPKVKAMIIATSDSGTIQEFAHKLGKSTQALRDAIRGKAPRVLAAMQARLGDLTH